MSISKDGAWQWTESPIDAAFLIDNTRRNATDARATDGGLGIENVRAGVPFPIPKDGREVMWNHRLRYQGRAVQFKYDSWLVDASGQRVLSRPHSRSGSFLRSIRNV